MISSITLWACVSLLAAGQTAPPGEPATAAVVDTGTDTSNALLEPLSASLTEAGYTVECIGVDALSDAAALIPERFSLLAFPDASTLPARASRPVEAYAEAGGDILALNTPMWQDSLIRSGDGWMSRTALLEARAAQPPDHVVFPFTDASVADWQRGCDTLANPTVYETIADGPGPDMRALHAVVPKLTNWDTFNSPMLDSPFPEDHTLTVFAARGGPTTTALAVEWLEKDGSRWIATAPLTSEWQFIVLRPQDFRFWQSVPARQNTTFNPANACKLSVGLALSHTRIPGNDNEYWVGPIGTAARDALYNEMLASAEIRAMDTLYPHYKLFDCTGVGSVNPRDDQVIAAPAVLPVPAVVRSPHPRPRGAGFDKAQQWRWIPLLEARTADGEWRGTPATMLVHADGPFKGGVWASFGAEDPAWYVSEGVRRVITDTARRMLNPVFLVDGGANFYTYFDDQDVVLGVRATNVGQRYRARLTGRVEVREVGAGKIVAKREWQLNLPPGEIVMEDSRWRPERWPRAGYVVTAELLDEQGALIDRLEHAIHVWRPKARKSYITTKDGEFNLDGERWRAHGVNYMPSSGIGAEDWEYFEHWVGERSYDPEVIQRDLDHCRDMGLNAVSIFIHYPSIYSQNLLDLLRRLEVMGIKANLSLRPGTPLDFEWDKMSHLINYYRIAEHDTVFALDLAWEPMWLDHNARKRWDKAWEAWIVERYGSVENAEKDWGFQVPRDESGAVTNPIIPQTDKDGPWRVMTAAYRRFLDTLLYDKYSAARALVRTLDPRHHVSFRMTEAGNPTCRWEGHLPYDYPYLAAAVDIIEPEAYGRIGDWDRVKPGMFQVEYARWAAPGKACLWAEAGVSVWVPSRGHASEERLAFQAQYYTDFYRMLIESAANGIFWWWYPGHYRVNERSDFGIIEPDGSDRAVTKVIRDHVEPFLTGPSAKKPDLLIPFDRDAHPDGIAGVYDAVKDQYWAAIAEGKRAALTSVGDGTTSEDCPELAVGNVPWTGSNPPKYLDGFFDRVDFLNAAGEWERVARGGTVRVASGPVRLRVDVTNLAEATWIPCRDGNHKGGVVVGVYNAEDQYVGGAPIPSRVARHESCSVEGLQIEVSDEPTEMTLSFAAMHRTRFGQKFQLTLIPVAADSK